MPRLEIAAAEPGRPPLRRASLDTSPPIDGGEERREVCRQSPYLAATCPQPFAKLRAAAQHRQEISRTYLHLERGRPDRPAWPEPMPKGLPGEFALAWRHGCANIRTQATLEDLRSWPMLGCCGSTFRSRKCGRAARLISPT
ncbi:MAG: hypothetical protein E5W90_25395 [Mesorhizobium sp.]|nr:MAG: hypothetical protein E5W90_25395 [Mesorhizobium sp.]